MPKSKTKYGSGTAWFLAILVISVIGAFVSVSTTLLWLVLGVCGAVVAILNIRVSEEKEYLHGVVALLLITIAFAPILPISELSNFLMNLSVGFGVAGFVIALSHIARISATS